MNRRLPLVLALVVSGCASKKPAIERDPGRYAPAETESRKESRLEERIHATRDRIDAWTRELDAGRGHAKDEAKLAAATERLHGCAEQLERVRVHANDAQKREGDSEDLERETLRIEASAERAYRDGLDALGRAGGEPAPR